MAIFNMFNFCTGGSEQAQGSAGTFSIVAETDHFVARFNPSSSTGELRFGLWGGDGAANNFDNTEAGCWVVFRVDYYPASEVTILKYLVTGTTDWFEVRMSSTGRLRLYNNTTQIGSDSGQCNPGVEQKLDLRLKVSATVGELAARLNGTEFANGGTSMNTGTANVIQMRIGAMDVNSSIDISFYRGVMQNTNAYPPDGEFCVMVPNASGTYAPTGGTYADIDEAPISTGDYAWLNPNPGTDPKASFNMTDPIVAPTTVYAVMAWINYQKGTSATGVKLLLRSGSTDDLTTSRTATGIKQSQKIYTVDPADSSAWTETDFDNLEIGFQCMGTISNLQSLYAAGVFVLYSRPSNIVGKGFHSSALSYAPQVKCITDGYHSAALFYDGDGTIAKVARLAFSTSDDDMWRDSQCPQLDTCTRGQHLSMMYQFENSYAIYGTMNLSTPTPFVCNSEKINRVLYPGRGSIGTAVSNISGYPSLVWTNNADSTQTVWLAGKNTTSNKIQVITTNDPNGFTSQSSPTDIHTITGTDGLCQMVRYSDGQVGILYTDDTTLYYKHYNGSWGSEETVSTSLNYFAQFRGVVTQNDKLVVMYPGPDVTPSLLLKEDGFYLLKEDGGKIIWEKNTVVNYRIRPLGGSWGTELDVSNDKVAGYVTACANMGKSEEVILFYQEDSSNDIAYRVWNGSVWSNKTSLVSAPSLQGSINTPDQAVGQVTLLYYTTDGYIRSKRLALNSTEFGTDGILVALNGQALGVNSINVQTFSFGGKTIVMWLGIDHICYARLLTDATNTFDSAAVKIYPYAFADNHSSPTFFGDDSGYVYLAIGDRNTSSAGTEYLNDFAIIQKSTYPINHASFSLSNWSDVSPDSVSGRGYKFILVDQAGVIYFIDTDVQASPNDVRGPIRIREYRSGAWSSSTSLVYGDNTNTRLYVQGVSLGNEPSGQKSIHLFWCWHDESGQPAWYGSDSLRMDTFYMKIVPQGNGTFKTYKADGTETTSSLPLNTTNSDTIFTQTEGYWSLAFGGACTLLNNIPFIALTIVSKTSPYPIQSIRGYYWSGSAWVYVNVRDSNFGISADPKTVRGSALFTTMQVDVGGTKQLVSYQSLDGGVTWSYVEQLTHSTVGAVNGLLSPRTTELMNLLWKENVSSIHREIRMKTFNIILPPTIQGVDSIQGIESITF